jgi:hypothetical protein
MRVQGAVVVDIKDFFGPFGLGTCRRFDFRVTFQPLAGMARTSILPVGASPAVGGLTRVHDRWWPSSAPTAGRTDFAYRS